MKASGKTKPKANVTQSSNTQPQPVQTQPAQTQPVQEMPTQPQNTLLELMRSFAPHPDLESISFQAGKTFGLEFAIVRDPRPGREEQHPSFQISRLRSGRMYWARIGSGEAGGSQAFLESLGMTQVAASKALHSFLGDSKTKPQTAGSEG